MRIDDLPVTERFVRASGPGGQNVNKVSTAVELRLHVGESGLPPGVAQRLRSLAGRRLTTDDVLVIDSREHRTQAQNRQAARARLSALIELAHVRPRKRVPSKPSAGAKQKRVTDKTERGRLKKTRGRVVSPDEG